MRGAPVGPRRSSRALYPPDRGMCHGHAPRAGMVLYDQQPVHRVCPPGWPGVSHSRTALRGRDGRRRGGGCARLRATRVSGVCGHGRPGAARLRPLGGTPPVVCRWASGGHRAPAALPARDASRRSSLARGATVTRADQPGAPAGPPCPGHGEAMRPSRVAERGSGCAPHGAARWEAGAAHDGAAPAPRCAGLSPHVGPGDGRDAVAPGGASAWGPARSLRDAPGPLPPPLCRGPPASEPHTPRPGGVGGPA